MAIVKVVINIMLLLMMTTLVMVIMMMMIMTPMMTITAVRSITMIKVMVMKIMVLMTTTTLIIMIIMIIITTPTMTISAVRFMMTVMVMTMMIMTSNLLPHRSYRAECARARETDLEDPNSPRGLTHFGRVSRKRTRSIKVGIKGGQVCESDGDKKGNAVRERLWLMKEKIRKIQTQRRIAREKGTKKYEMIKI